MRTNSARIPHLLSRGNNSQLAAGDRGPLSRIYVRRWRRRRAAFGFILDRARRFMRPIRLSLSVDLRVPPPAPFSLSTAQPSSLTFHPSAISVVRFAAPCFCIYDMRIENFYKLYL